MDSRRSALVAALVLTGLAAACSSSPDAGSSNAANAAPAAEPKPEAKCAPSGPLPADGWFTDITDDVGLKDVEGLRVASADIDGDGFPDLVIHTMPTKRDTMEAPSKRVFLNKGGLRYEEITKESGLMDSRDGKDTGRLSHFSVFADVDNDGDLDLFDATYIDANTDAAAAAADRSEIFINDGKGHFTMAPRTGPSKSKLPSSGASFADFDRDGNIDLFVGTFYDGSEGAGTRLYHGQGDGAFTDVSTGTKILRPETNGDRDKYLKGDNRKPAYGITACDVDDDGEVDLIVSSYGRSFNELWRNTGEMTFTEVGYGTPFAADDDVDYKSDNEFYHCWCSEAANANQCSAEHSKPKVGCDRYSWTPGFDDQPARNAGNTFTTACADLDNDGDMDMIHATIRHWHIGQSSDPSQIIRNDGNLQFSRLPNDEKTLLRKHSIPDWNDGDMDVGAFDFDNDGRKDIWLSSSDYPDTWGSLFQQQEDGSFKDVSLTSGFRHYHAHAFASVDIDGDGDLDLIVATSLARCGGDKLCPAKGAIRVYRNNVGSARNWTKLRLHGKGAGFSNAAAIGAKVTVIAGGVRQVQEVGGGYGHFGLQHDTALTFGLGATCSIDAIEVRWPNGEKTVQRFEGVVPNYTIDITEGDKDPKYKK